MQNYGHSFARLVMLQVIINTEAKNYTTGKSYLFHQLHSSFLTFLANTKYLHFMPYRKEVKFST